LGPQRRGRAQGDGALKRLIVAGLRLVLGACGRLCAWFVDPVRAPVVCVLATPNMGGAEQVHANIVAAIADHGPEVWFTELPRDAGLLARFESSAAVVQLGRRLRYRLCAYFQAGLQAGRISRGQVHTVFGCFSHFFYDMLPWLKGVRCIDLLHNFGVNFENYSLPHVARLDARVVITQTLREKLRTHYRHEGINTAWMARVQVIGNSVPIAASVSARPSHGPLRVLYVGRGTPEKRVHLVGRVARDMGPAASFTLVGDVETVVQASDRQFCRFTGMLTDPAALAAEYDSADVLVLASEREGFPVVVMEAMARGVVPLCTAVGGLHELPPQTRMLVTPEPPDQAVSELVAALHSLAADRAALQRMSAAARAYAVAHFGHGRARQQWRHLLLKEAS